MKILGVTRTRSLCKNTFSRHCRRWFFLTNWRKCVGFGPGFGVSFLDRDCAAPFCFGARFSSSRLAPLIRRSSLCARRKKKIGSFLRSTPKYTGHGAGQKKTEKTCFLSARSFCAVPLVLLPKIKQFALRVVSHHLCSRVEKTLVAPPTPFRFSPVFGQGPLFCNYSP